MANDSKYVTLTESNFRNEVLESSKPVLVDFWASWCGPCHIIAPAIEELASDYDGQATVGKLNVDEQPGIAQEYGIQSIPSVLFFQDGKIVDQVVGAVPKKALAEKLNRLVAVA